MRLITPVTSTDFPVSISLKDKIMILGSCFADNIGSKMKDSGFDVCVNPFGTLYNPASVCSAVERLDSGRPFTGEDCVEMGAGAGLICSFSHHTSFARPGRDEFLENANARLAEASSFWKECNRLIVTFGTAMVWMHDGEVVSNCLKRPGTEFTHEMLELDDAANLMRCIVSYGKETIFTVSPIRHLSEGAHINTLSKATLQLAAAETDGAAYFPAYEILLDELRDYRFFAEDMCHPSNVAIEYIWEKFVEAAVPESERGLLKENEKAARRSAHRPITGRA